MYKQSLLGLIAVVLCLLLSSCQVGQEKKALKLNDTMDPKHMEWMAGEVQFGRYLHCPYGSHLSMYDDPETYFRGLIQFIKDVDQEIFK